MIRVCTNSKDSSMKSMMQYMNPYYIRNIHINKLYHLVDFDIPMTNPEMPHLIITGKNGSGKTILLNAIAEFLNSIKGQKSLGFLSYEKYLSDWKDVEQNAEDDQSRMKAKEQIDYYVKKLENLFGKVNIQVADLAKVIEKHNNGDFLMAFYQANRKVNMVEPKNPTKPEYNKIGEVKRTATSQFLNFLSDLKIQEALARNEKQTQAADEINVWFIDFEKLLRQIFQDNHLKLEFNYKDYSFRINTEGKSFKFTELSDGFAAVLDIVADLILKMQGDGGVTKSYRKEGIVLIDEIETHLHLELQKIIMPILTKVFPNIQFIVTTHSPFVLNSMDNAIAYDLEHREVLGDLTDYSYEALAEGYFGVKTPSSYSEMQLDKFKQLLSKEDLSDADIVEIKLLKSDFEKIPEALSPQLVGAYQQVLMANSEKLRRLL